MKVLILRSKIKKNIEVCDQLLYGPDDFERIEDKTRTLAMVRRTGTHKDMPVDALMAWCRSKPAPQEFFGGTTRVRHRSRSHPGTTSAANKNVGKVRHVTAFSPLTSSTSPHHWQFKFLQALTGIQMWHCGSCSKVGQYIASSKKL
jgi:hypothetical protein